LSISQNKIHKMDKLTWNLIKILGGVLNILGGTILAIGAVKSEIVYSNQRKGVQNQLMLSNQGKQNLIGIILLTIGFILVLFPQFVILIETRGQG
jgi:hypothetical protein